MDSLERKREKLLNASIQRRPCCARGYGKKDNIYFRCQARNNFKQVFATNPGVRIKTKRRESRFGHALKTENDEYYGVVTMTKDEEDIFLLIFFSRVHLA